MSTTTSDKTGSTVVSALSARANFGKLLDRVDGERRSLVIQKRGTPKAVLLSIRDYVKLAAPEPEVLRIIGEESQRNGTNTLTSGQIDQAVRLTGKQFTAALERMFHHEVTGMNYSYQELVQIVVEILEMQG